MLRLSLFASMLFIANGLLAQPGSLDPDFGNNGVQHTAIGVGNSTAQSVVVLDDGTILVAGGSENPADHFTVAKFLTDGSLAPGFGFGSGITHFNVESQEGWANDLTVQSDGKILVTGPVYPNPQDFGIARLNADGSLDNSYGGGDGRVVVDVNGNEVAYGIIELSDGKTLVTGFSSGGLGTGVSLIKLNSDGSLDPNFDVDGKVFFSPTGNDVGYNVCELPDGKILVGGYSAGGATTNFDFALFRFLPDGTPDASFGNGGLVRIDFDDSNEEAFGMFIDTNGKILLGGTSDGLFAVCRLHPDGSLDESFSFDGKVRTLVGGGIVSGRDILEQPDGKILVVGFADGPLPTSDIDLVVVRYLSDGTLDGSFGQNGVVRIDGSQENFNDRVYSFALQPDGMIMIVGATALSNGTSLMLVRMISGLNVGTLDVGLDQSSVLVYPNPIADREIQLTYTLQHPRDVSIYLTTTDGRQERLLAPTRRSAGEQTESLQLPADLPAGNYWLQLRTAGGSTAVQISVNR